MITAASVGIKGIEEVVKRMEKIDRSFNRKVMIPAVRAALKPIRTKAKKLQVHKSLKELISSKAFISKKGDILGKVYLMPAKGRKIKLEGREVGFEVVGNILEFGSTKRNIKPQPFMRPAREQESGKAKRIIEKEARKRITVL